MMRTIQKTAACLLLFFLAAAVFSGCRKEIPVTDIPDPAISAAPAASVSPSVPTSPDATPAPGSTQAIPEESGAPSATAAPSGGAPSGNASSGNASSGGSASPGNTPGTSGNGSAGGTVSGSGSGSGSDGNSGSTSGGSSGTGTPPVTEEGYLINFEYIHNGDGTARFSDYRKNIAFDSPTDLDVLSDGIGETAVLLTDRNNGYAIGDNVSESCSGTDAAYLKDYLDRNLPAYFEALYGGFESDSLSYSASGNAAGTVVADGKTYTVQAELIPTGSGGTMFKAVIAPDDGEQLSTLSEGMMDLREAY